MDSTDARPGTATHVSDDDYRRFTSCLIAGQRSVCAEIVESELAAETGIREIYTDLFQRSLYDVGEQWERGQVSVAVEHMATAIVDRMLTIVQPHVFGGEERSKTAIIACVADEYHQLGARMVADLFELHGWRGYFLGADTPIDSLLEMIETHRPDVVGLSLSIYFNLPSLLTAVEAVRTAYPEQQILIGGQAFRWGGGDALPDVPQVIRAFTLQDLEQYLESVDAD